MIFDGSVFRCCPIVADGRMFLESSLTTDERVVITMSQGSEPLIVVSWKRTKCSQREEEQNQQEGFSNVMTAVPPSELSIVCTF